MKNASSSGARRTKPAPSFRSRMLLPPRLRGGPGWGFFHGSGVPAVPTRRFAPPSPKTGRERGAAPPSIQREHEQIARRFQIVVLDRMEVATATLHRDVLLRPDRVGDG